MGGAKTMLDYIPIEAEAEEYSVADKAKSFIHVFFRVIHGMFFQMDYTESFLTGNALRACLISTCSAAFVLIGYDQTLIGNVIRLPSFRRDFDYPDSNTEGIIASFYDIGCLLGALASFLFGDRLGRRFSVLWSCLIVIVGAIFQSSASSRSVLIVSRVVTGIGNGVISCIIPVWQAESFKSNNRGALLVIQSASISFGVPLGSWLAFLSSRSEPSSFSWRFPIACEGLLASVVLLGLPFLPESPRWLVMEDRVLHASKIFAQYKGRGVSVLDPEVIKECNTIVESVQRERERGTASWKEVFTEGPARNLSRVLLGIGPYLFNQWSGINALAYFLPPTFELNIGLSKDLSLIVSGVLGTQYFVFSILPYFFIERAGRRKILMLSSAGCSLCMAVIVTALSLNVKKADWIFVAATFLYFDIFSWGILPVSWMYASEIMPLRTRNKGVAIGVSAHWFSNFIIVYVTPLAIQHLQYRFYIIFAVLCASFIPIVYLFYPETARRSLEQMDVIMENERFGITKTRRPAPVQTQDESEKRDNGENVYSRAGSAESLVRTV